MYSIDEKFLIYLSCFEFLTYDKLDKLLYSYQTPSKLIHNFIEKKYDITKIISEEEYNKILKYLDQNIINTYLKKLEDQNIVCITYYSENYPEKLRQIENPPFILYCKGDLSLLNTKSIAIVGTRKPTSYGEGITKDFAEGLANNGLTIVSGLAYGVDKIANETALKYGKTIAVLGGGFNNIYPAVNTNLANEIAKNGLLISEYHIDVKPKHYYFPVRNRIIAGLADAVLITEASEKSGSMHTKEYALDFGREVYAVPGNINSENSAGTNKLIKSGQGYCVTCYQDVLEEMKIQITTKKDSQKDIKLSSNEKLVVDCLKKGEKHFEEIIALTHLDIKTANTCLTTLSIRGIIKRLAGNYYSL